MKCLRKRGGGDGLCIYIFLSGAQGSVQCMGGLLNQMLSHLNNLLCTLESGVCMCVCVCVCVVVFKNASKVKCLNIVYVHSKVCLYAL